MYRQEETVYIEKRKDREEIRMVEVKVFKD